MARDQDTTNGDNGNDTLRGDTSDDTLYGDTSDDTLYGDTGDDYLDGGPTLTVRSDIPSLHGDTGDDYLDGGIASTPSNKEEPQHNANNTARITRRLQSTDNTNTDHAVSSVLNRWISLSDVDVKLSQVVVAPTGDSITDTQSTRMTHTGGQTEKEYCIL